MSDRTATFAGFLSFGDYEIDAEKGLVTIKAATCLPSAAPAHRSPRPFTRRSTGWNREYEGLGAEEVGRRQAPILAGESDEKGFLPGIPLETWLLPRTDSTFHFLITPAGKWPQAPEASPAVVPFGVSTSHFASACRLIATHLTALADDMDALDQNASEGGALPEAGAAGA